MWKSPISQLTLQFESMKNKYKCLKIILQDTFINLYVVIREEKSSV